MLLKYLSFILYTSAKEGYNEEMQKQEAPEEIPPTIEEQALGQFLLCLQRVVN